MYGPQVVAFRTQAAVRSRPVVSVWAAAVRLLMQGPLRGPVPKAIVWVVSPCGQAEKLDDGKWTAMYTEAVTWNECHLGVVLKSGNATGAWIGAKSVSGVSESVTSVNGDKKVFSSAGVIGAEMMHGCPRCMSETICGTEIHDEVNETSERSGENNVPMIRRNGRIFGAWNGSGILNDAEKAPCWCGFPDPSGSGIGVGSVTGRGEVLLTEPRSLLHPDDSDIVGRPGN